jgi:hypothetical protein
VATTPEAQLLTKALAGDLGVLLTHGFDPSILDYPYDEVFEIIIDHYRKYNEIPKASRLKELTERLGSIPVAPAGDTSPILMYWDQVRTAALKNRLKNCLEELANVYNENKMPPTEFVQHVIREMAELDANRAFGGGVVSLGNMADDLLDDYSLASEGKIPGIDIPDEFTYLKGSLVKLEPGHITTLVSRRSVGKTWKGLILLLHGAMTGHHGLAASMEMPRKDLSRRLAALAADLNFNDIKKGTLERDDRLKYQKFLRDMSKGKGFWDFIHIMEPREIKNVFAVENRAHAIGAEMVFADAFYLYPGPQEERWQRIEANLSDVRAVSLDTMRHWVLTAQFNRRAKGQKTADEFAIGGSDSFNQDSNNIIHLVQRKIDKKNRHIIFELAKGRDCDVQFPWLHHWNFLTMQRGPIGLFNTGDGNAGVGAGATYS